MVHTRQRNALEVLGSRFGLFAQRERFLLLAPAFSGPASSRALLQELTALCRSSSRLLVQAAATRLAGSSTLLDCDALVSAGSRQEAAAVTVLDSGRPGVRKVRHQLLITLLPGRLS